MTRGGKIFVGIMVVAVLSVGSVMAVRQAADRGIEVRMDPVARRDLTSVVTVSGNIRARLSVDISSDVQGRVIDLAVREGDFVEPGQLLLRLDPTQLLAAEARALASLQQSKAQVSQQQASLLGAQRDMNRLRALRDRDPILITQQQFDDARTVLDVGEAQLNSLQFGVSQAEAALEEARDRLSKATILAPISGRVTRLNVEEGETVIVGLTNNPGSLILTIGDLQSVEAVMAVDETEVPQISLGDSASIELDAFPGRVFLGQVTKIGNSAIRPPIQSSAAGQVSTIDFEVVITLEEAGVSLRPDLSATADIVTDIRRDVLSVPIIALTVRDRASLGETNIVEEPMAEDDPDRGAPVRRETVAERRAAYDVLVEGVFVVRDGFARFVQVEVGIAGFEHFEILSGLKEGDLVVSGPYQVIRELVDGTEVKELRVGG